MQAHTRARRKPLKDQTGARSLINLNRAGSTSRVLNLLRASGAILAAGGTERDLLFETRILNRAFILKHRLRTTELDTFSDGRFNATKVIIPLDANDLSAGGRFMFVGQAGWLSLLAEDVGVAVGPEARDVQLLEALDRLPSFDPFLLREWLRRFNFRAHPAYLELNETDIAGMEQFVFNEVSNLVTMSLTGGARHETILRLVRKMLSDDGDQELEPLRLTLRMTETEFREGLFCWKGFLYYKWVAKGVENQIAPVIAEMRARTPSRGLEAELARQIEQSRRRIAQEMLRMFNSASECIGGYDEAYRRLTEARDPIAFKQFLLNAPASFLRLGDLLGQLQHIVQFWRFRVGGGFIAVEEFAQILKDFEEGMAIRIV